jgi:hypothetical protein
MRIGETKERIMTFKCPTGYTLWDVLVENEFLHAKRTIRVLAEDEEDAGHIACDASSNEGHTYDIRPADKKRRRVYNRELAAEIEQRREARLQRMSQSMSVSSLLPPIQESGEIKIPGSVEEAFTEGWEYTDPEIGFSGDLKKVEGHFEFEKHNGLFRFSIKIPFSADCIQSGKSSLEETSVEAETDQRVVRFTFDEEDGIVRAFCDVEGLELAAKEFKSVRLRVQKQKEGDKR